MAVAFPPRGRGGTVELPGNMLPASPAWRGAQRKLTPADVDTEVRWSDFMHRPDAQAAYEAQVALQAKKKQWLEERQLTEERARRRKLVADAIEEAPAETKKLIAQIFHIRIVEDFLWQVYDECVRSQRNFVERLRIDDKVQMELRNYLEHFQAGGEERMEELERQVRAINEAIALDEERKMELRPSPIDVHTLKELLEYAQQCKFEGNARYREGLYEEALAIYSQADEAMKKWKVEKHLKNEHKWLTDNHLACLKNKAQAALNLELFQTALEAADAALAIDPEDHKAWYRKVQAEKGLGKFEDAEASLVRLEDVAQWCPDRRNILRDCEAERKRLKIARAKNKANTQEMLGKAFQAGIFSVDRERELEEASRSLEAPASRSAPKIASDPVPRPPVRAIEEPKPLERKIQLTAALAGDLMDELAEAYSQPWFQERVRKCARDSGYERSVFLMRLKDVAFKVQKPVLEKWGFEGTEQGVREMTAAIRDHAANGKEMPEWLRSKQDRCLQLLYGGKEGGMLGILT